jgi:transposase
VVTREGFPLGFEVFPGNRHDSKTMQEIVERMETRYGQASRIWAMDRGMVSEEALNWLRRRGSRFIVGTPKNQLQKWERQLLEGDWSTIRDGLEVKRCHCVPEADTYILCRSLDRSAKEQAMRQRFATRIETRLTKMAATCERRRSTVGLIERRIGRLLEKNSRASRFYNISVLADATGRAKLEWSRREEEWSRAGRRDGCYVLRSNVPDWSAEELWKAYIQLTQAEAAFRIQKDELQMRPVWHQKAQRVRAHILVCFLAYAMWKTLEGWTKRAGLGSSIATMLEEFARIQSTDVVIPTVDGRTVRLRCIVRPDAQQKVLLDRLGLTLPSRLRIPKGVGQM